MTRTEDEQTVLAPELPTATAPAPASTPAVEVKASKPRKSKPRKKPFRLLKFDKFLLEVVRRGESDSESLRQRYNLDPFQFESRLRELAVRGYVIPDAANPRILRFGLEGFNAFPPKLPADPKKEAPVEKTRPGPAIPDPTSPKASRSAPVEPDLSELLAKGRPDPSYTKTFLTISAVGRKWLEEQGQRKPVEETLILEVPSRKNKERHAAAAPAEAKPQVNGSEERCELCRASFLLAVGKEAHPKYGHCFCGAPYHKDCYDSLLEGSGTQCVRCGKRLSLILDKVSEEAVKELKKLFD